MADDSDDEQPVVLPIGPELDLHSFRPRDIVSVLDEYVREAAAAGLTRVRIVHGRGKGCSEEWYRLLWSGTLRCAPSGTIRRRILERLSRSSKYNCSGGSLDPPSTRSSSGLKTRRYILKAPTFF